MPLVIRPIDTGERNLVLQTWIRSSKRSRFAELVPEAVFEREQHSAIERVFWDAHVLVAELSEVPGEVHGWICFEPHALHYVYTKLPYRRSGVATALWSATGCVARECSHRTRVAEDVPWIARLAFNPFLMWR